MTPENEAGMWLALQLAGVLFIFGLVVALLFGGFPVSERDETDDDPWRSDDEYWTGTVSQQQSARVVLVCAAALAVLLFLGWVSR